MRGCLCCGNRCRSLRPVQVSRIFGGLPSHSGRFDLGHESSTFPIADSRHGAITSTTLFAGRLAVGEFHPFAERQFISAGG